MRSSTSLFFAGAALAAGCGTTVIGGEGGAPPTTSSSGNPSTSSSTSSSTSASSSASSTSSSSSSSSTSGDPHAEPPAPGPMSTPDGMGPATFAVSKLYLGDTDRDGAPNQANGWKQFGFDLDGKVSTASSLDLCLPLANAPPKGPYPDGLSGIDNSFGKNLLPLFLGLTGTFSASINDAIASGDGTILFDLEALGGGANYNPLSASVLLTGALPSPPAWAGGDVWPIPADNLSAPPILGSAKVATTQSYVVGDVWVGVFEMPFGLPLRVLGFDLVLTIERPVVAMQLDAAHQHATNGTIAGVIRTTTMTEAMKQIAGSFDPTLCSGPTLESIIAQIQQASDILADGSQDPTKPCDGISIGIGFDAVRAQIGAVTPPSPPPPNPCGP